MIFPSDDLHERFTWLNQKVLSWKEIDHSGYQLKKFFYGLKQTLRQFCFKENKEDNNECQVQGEYVYLLDVMC